MQSNLPKVLHLVGGKPMLWHVIRTAWHLAPAGIHVVVGPDGQQVRDTLESMFTPSATPINWVTQAEPKGTGHAVCQAMPFVARQSRCLVLYGDVPLVDPEELRRFCQTELALGILTAVPTNPSGLGRILRNSSGQIQGIVEHQDATSAQLAIREVNTGILMCPADWLARWLKTLDCDNRQGEYYLTDIVGQAATEGVTIHGTMAQAADRCLGINSRAEQAVAERTFQQLMARQLMEVGVTLMDPERIDIRGEVRFGRDCVVDVNVVLEGHVEVGDSVLIGPGCVIRDAHIGNHCQIHPHSVVDKAVLGNHCQVGPFARLRPDTRLADHVRIGNFVEINKSQLAEGVKANHLTYIGNSRVGRNSNLGAGVITCNYDGVNKHQTVIGDNVFVGSDSQLVAPVQIADGATIGAGTTVTRNVDRPGLVVSRTRQKFLATWKRPKSES